MSITTNIESKNTRRSVILIFISVLLGIVYQSTLNTISNSQSFLLVLLSNLTGYWGCFSFFKNNNLPKISRQFIAIVFYLFLVGLSYGTIFKKEVLTLALVQDFRYVMYLMAGCVFGYSKNLMVSFHAIMKVLSVIATILGLYALVYFDFSYVSIETRGSTWSMSYLLWWTAGACWIYWAYYGLFIKKDILYAIWPVAIYIVLGLLFLKREVIAYSGVILLVFWYFNRKHIGNFLKSSLFVIALILVVFSIKPELFGNVYDMMMDRFKSVEDIAEFDRTIESQIYLSEASLRQILFGNGIGHYHAFINMDMANLRGVLNATHLGYVNILYKGGIVFVIFYITLLMRIINRLRERCISPYVQVCIGSSLSYIISLFYAGSWTYTIAPFCISAPLFFVVSYGDRR